MINFLPLLKKRNFLSLFAAYTGSVYMTVILTLERFVAVCWPLKSSRILTDRKSAMGILIVLVGSILLNLPRWNEAQSSTVKPTEVEFGVDIYYRVYIEPKNPIGWKRTRDFGEVDLLQYKNYRQYYHGWLWLTLMYGIPIPLLIILNFKIWIQVRYVILLYSGIKHKLCWVYILVTHDLNDK